jgi:hypothetical protein
VAHRKHRLDFHVGNGLSLYNGNSVDGLDLIEEFFLRSKSTEKSRTFAATHQQDSNRDWYCHIKTTHINPYLSSQGPKSSNGTVIINLKSKQAPQTNLLTVISFDAFLISGKNSSTALAISSKLLEVALSPSYLHLHSRQTRLNDMAPLANGTDSADNAVDDEKARSDAGAKAEAVAANSV